MNLNLNYGSSLNSICTVIVGVPLGLNKAHIIRALTQNDTKSLPESNHCQYIKVGRKNVIDFFKIYNKLQLNDLHDHQ